MNWSPAVAAGNETLLSPLPAAAAVPAGSAALSWLAARAWCRTPGPACNMKPPALLSASSAKGLDWNVWASAMVLTPPRGPQTARQHQRAGRPLPWCLLVGAAAAPCCFQPPCSCLLIQTGVRLLLGNLSLVSVWLLFAGVEICAVRVIPRHMFGWDAPFPAFHFGCEPLDTVNDFFRLCVSEAGGVRSLCIFTPLFPCPWGS